MASYKRLEDIGRVKLSDNFFMRDFLYSEISNFYGVPNIPENLELATEVGSMLCKELLEPLKKKFGHVSIRSGYRSPKVNEYGNKNNLNCASNESNAGHHIWDRVDKNGHKGATACVVIPSFVESFSDEGDWQKLAWWVHDNLPYSSMYFFPKLWAFNLRWCEEPEKWIKSYTEPKGILTKKGMANFGGTHEAEYSEIINLL